MEIYNISICYNIKLIIFILVKVFELNYNNIIHLNINK